MLSLLLGSGGGHSGPSTAVMVIVPIFIILGLGLVAGGIWYLVKGRKRRTKHAVFHHLDLLEQDNVDHALEEEMPEQKTPENISLDEDDTR
jgi:LPXTG-motif cell wall-anchored protein